MKKHIKLYFAYFALGEQDLVVDEYEWVVNGIMVRASDIHHIDPRGMGGSKSKDYIENLIALSRENHDRAEDKTLLPSTIQSVHNEFLVNNPYKKFYNGRKPL